MKYSLNTGSATESRIATKRVLPEFIVNLGDVGNTDNHERCILPLKSFFLNTGEECLK